MRTIAGAIVVLAGAILLAASSVAAKDNSLLGIGGFAYTAVGWPCIIAPVPGAKPPP